MSSNPAVRALRLPPADFFELQIPRILQPARNWFRVHRSCYSAATFSLAVHHRFSHKDCPDPLLYLGADIDTCLFERFGDTVYDNQLALPRSLWDAHSVSVIHVPRLEVCDLTKAKTLSAMRVDLSALMHHDLSAPQEWGLAIQRHLAHFQAIKFKSRFNGKTCLALFQRGGIEKQLKETSKTMLPNNDAAVDWLDKHAVSLY